MLEVHDLRVVFHTRQGVVTALAGVNLALPSGKVVGLVGESGCGKSMTALSIMRLLPRRAEVRRGRILLEGQDVLALSEREMERVRGARIAMIFQQPRASLNPVFPVWTQLVHVLRLHRGLSDRAARAEGEAMLARVGLPEPKHVMNAYPHQLSGGMCQRVMMALALACGSRLLIADEPTTALDVTIQYQIVELLRELQRDLGLTVLLITHDLGLVAEMCDVVHVMYAGRVVESAPIAELFRRPAHPYTRGLMASRIRTGSRALPKGIPGRVPDLHQMPAGCPFHPRCPLAAEICRQDDPAPEVVAGEHLVRCHVWQEGRS
ncbi:MAG: ABC transporter ATP-binding protein [Chloroflexi bacterium]|nr:ABC transporter ATP-binding protein [Chloroflexota bacterium]